LAATAELSFAALHFGAQILRAQVSPCWRRQRLAMLLCTLALKSCMRRCRLGGDGGVKLRCFALRCSIPACASGSLVATAALKATLLCTSVLKSRMRRCRLGGDGGVSALLLHFCAQFLHVQVSPGWRRRRVATLLRTSVLESCMREVAWMATAACSHAASHFGVQILHAQVSPGWRRRRVATLLRTSVLTSCICRCHPDGDGGV